MKINRFILPIGATIAVGVGAGTYLAVAIGQAATISASDQNIKDFWHKQEMEASLKPTIVMAKSYFLLDEVNQNALDKKYIEDKGKEITADAQAALIEADDLKAEIEKIMVAIDGISDKENSQGFKGINNLLRDFVLPIQSSPFYKLENALYRLDGNSVSLIQPEIEKLSANQALNSIQEAVLAKAVPASINADPSFKAVIDGVPKLIKNLEALKTKLTDFNSMATKDTGTIAGIHSRQYFSMANQVQVSDEYIKNNKTYFIPKTQATLSGKNESKTSDVVTRNDSARKFWVGTEVDPITKLGSDLNSPLVGLPLTATVGDILSSDNFKNEFKSISLESDPSKQSSIIHTVTSFDANNSELKTPGDWLEDIVTTSYGNLSDLYDKGYFYRRNLEQQLIAPTGSENGATMFLKGLAEYATIFSADNNNIVKADKTLDSANVKLLADSLKDIRVSNLYTLFPSYIYDVQFGLTVGTFDKAKHPDLATPAQRSNDISGYNERYYIRVWAKDRKALKILF